MRSLTSKQRQFVCYYLGKANGNATEAARMAGYAKPNIQSARLLVNVSIRAAIDARLESAALSADEVLARLSDMATVDMADFVDFEMPARPAVHTDADPGEDAWTDSGHRLNLAQARRRGKTHLIKKITAGKYGLSIELHDAQAALDKLARYHGLYNDKLEINDLAGAQRLAANLERRQNKAINQDGDTGATGPGHPGLPG